MINDDKPKGYFKYILALDSETTGLNFDSKMPIDKGHQAVSWGFIVAESETLKTVEELYVEIKLNNKSKQILAEDPTFNVRASAIHGLTTDHLNKHGIEEEQAVIQIATLILKYWGPMNRINCLGHNIASFDIPFLKSMFRRHQVDISISSRHCDSNSIGFCTVGSFVSDDFFSTMGCDDRSEHNALEDARMSLESCRRVQLLWKSEIGVTVEK